MKSNVKEVKLVNMKQVSGYIKYGIQPIRVEVSDRLVFVFDKQETKEVWKLWLDFKLPC